MITRMLRAESSRDIAVAFNAATALFALPLYVPLYASPGVLDLARLVFLVQVVPTIAIFAIGVGLRRLRGTGFLWRAYWIAVTLAALASFFRLWQRQITIGFPDAPSWAKVAALASIVPVMIVLAAVRADWIPRSFGRVAPVTGVVCAAFLVFIQLSTPVTRVIASETRSARDDAVFIFIFDELGRDVLQRGGSTVTTEFPETAALASDGISLSDGTANYSASCQSIPSMLSGRTQHACNESFLVGDQASLLTGLAAAYKLEIYEEYLRGCPDGADVCKGIPYLTARYPLAGITSHLFPQSIRVGPTLDQLGGRDGNPYTLALWSDFIEQVRTADLGGRAFFVHINIPHSPYAYQADGTLSRSPPRSQYFYGTEQDAVAYENYREQVRFVDALVGTLVGLLRQRGAYDSATIVITGDHGPRLQVPPHTETLVGMAAQTPNVPVIIKSPGLGRLPQSREYQHLDFTPTVLDVLGLLGTQRFDGRSALGSDATPREKWFLTGETFFTREPSGVWGKA